MKITPSYDRDDYYYVEVDGGRYLRDDGTEHRFNELKEAEERAVEAKSLYPDLDVRIIQPDIRVGLTIEEPIVDIFDSIPQSVQTGFLPANLVMGDFQQYTIDHSTVINTYGSYGGTIPANMPYQIIKARNGISDCPYPPTNGDPVASNRGRGWVTTQTSIPDAMWSTGTAGTIPGYYNNTCLMIENFSYTLANQGDIQMVHGDPAQSDPEYIPGDLWIQFWVFFPAVASALISGTSYRMLSNFNNQKLFYPLKHSYVGGSGSYQNETLDWLTHIGTGGKSTPILKDPARTGVVQPVNTDDRFFRPFSEDGGTVDYLDYPWQTYGDTQTGDSALEWKLGHVDPDTGIPKGKWHLVRLHYNTSEAANTASRQLAEGYIREQGTADFSLMYRWQQGQDYLPDMTSLGFGRGGTFDWNLQGAKVGGAAEGQWGHKCIQWPITLAPANPTEDEGDCRMYISDLVLATGTDSGGGGTADLPVYTAY